MRDVVWVTQRVRKDLRDFPDDVRQRIGYALFEVQNGSMPAHAKALKGYGGGVIELVEDYSTDTYRAVYATKIDDDIYILHCFKKKSSQGSKTPRPDLKTIYERLKRAEAIAASRRSGTAETVGGHDER